MNPRIFARSPAWRIPMEVCCVLMSPAGYAVAGAAVSASSVAVLYVAWVGILGFSYSVFDVWTRAHILGWWAVDGKKRIGITLTRVSAAVGAIFYTLFTGWIAVYGSVELALYMLAAFELLLALPLAYGVYAGWLPNPPSVKSFSFWLNESQTRILRKEEEEAAAASTSASEISAKSLSSSATAPRSEGSVDAASASIKDFESVYGRPVGTTRSVPVVLANRFEAATYYTMWILSGYFLAAVAGTPALVRTPLAA